MRELSELNLCFIAGTLGQGGAERQLYYWLTTLKEHGARVQLYCLTQGDFWEERLRQRGVPVTWIGQPGSRLTRLRRLLAAVRQLQPRPQLIQSQHIYANLYAAAAARVLGLREIGALRADTVHEVRIIGPVLGRLSLHVPRTIAANSHQALHNAAALGVAETRLRLLQNVVDTDYFQPVPRAPQPVVTISAIGRLVEQKRMDRLLQIYARLRAQTAQPLRLVIAGAGPLREPLERQAADLKLSVEWRGAVPDARTLYAETDILAMTSDWEGTPNAVLEAMACGLPVVGTRVGDLPKLVLESETGFHCAPNDEAGLTAALLRLVNDPALRARLGHSARAHIVTNHSLRELPRRLLTFYQTVLAQ